jgi:putative membrane protein
MLRYTFFSWWYLAHLLGNVLWIILLVVLAIALIRWLTRHRTSEPPFYPGPTYTGQPDHPGQLTAMDILRQRYARGEIDAATFEQMRERLEGTNRS